MLGLVRREGQGLRDVSHGKKGVVQRVEEGCVP